MFTQSLTRWVPHDGYIRHQNDHLSGRMTDISVMGEWQVAGVGGTRPLKNVLGEALKGRFSFEARNYLFSFQSYVRFEEFFCFPRFWKIWRQMFKLWGFWFRRCFGGSFWNSARSPGIFFCELWLRPQVFLENFLSFFPKQSRFYLPDSYGDPKSEQTTLVMVRRKLEWNSTSGRWRDRAQKDHRSSSRLVRVVCDDPWSRREKKAHTHTRKSACDCAKAQPFIIYKPASFEEPVSETRRRYRFALRCFRGRGCTAAGRSGCSAGTAKKAVIRDISGVDHWGVTNLSAPIWFTGQWHCTVFHHVMQLSLLVLCWKSTWTVILPQIKKKKSLSNVGHRGTKAENLAWHSTG